MTEPSGMTGLYVSANSFFSDLMSQLAIAIFVSIFVILIVAFYWYRKKR